MKKITVSAPGKLMLFGEHAVVYGHPCIVTAVDSRMFVTAEVTSSGSFELNAPDVQIKDYIKPTNEIGNGEIPKGAQFIEVAIKNVLEKYKKKLTGFSVVTRSEFSSKFGFGSSSASTVCIVKALSELLSLKLSSREIFDISFKTVLEIQGKGSGFDVAAAVYGGTLYFVTGGKVIKPLKIKTLPLIVGYSGIKADTVKLINKVSRKFDKKQKRLNQIYDDIEEIVERGRAFMLSEKWEEVGILMDANQKLLKELGVSIEKLDNMIYSASKSGAYGAKLSGAGGGDCIIALAPNSKRKAVESGIEKAGGTILSVRTNARGVKVEK